MKLSSLLLNRNFFEFHDFSYLVDFSFPVDTTDSEQAQLQKLCGLGNNNVTA